MVHETYVKCLNLVFDNVLYVDSYLCNKSGQSYQKSLKIL